MLLYFVHGYEEGYSFADTVIDSFWFPCSTLFPGSWIGHLLVPGRHTFGAHRVRTVFWTC
eukprot:707614-Rhodomonas_salina.1